MIILMQSYQFSKTFSFPCILLIISKRLAIVHLQKYKSTEKYDSMSLSSYGGENKWFFPFSKPSLFKKNWFYLLIFRERERKGEREGEKHQCVVASCCPHYWGPGLQPSVCLDWGSNWWPFDSEASTQSTEPHLPGPKSFLL